MGIPDTELVAPLSQGTSVKLKIHRSKRGKLILDACLKCEQVVNQIDPKSSRVHSFDKAVRIIEPVTLGQKTVITMEKDSKNNPLSKFEYRVTEVDPRSRSADTSGEKAIYLTQTENWAEENHERHEKHESCDPGKRPIILGCKPPTIK